MAMEFGAACCTPAPPAKPEHIGKDETIAGLRVYVTGPRAASKAVILLSDVFGYNAPLQLKLADKVGAAGYLTLVPDLLHGDFFSGDWSTLPEWKSKHLPTGAPVAETKRLVEAVGVESVGLAGFCWGAKVAVCVAKEKVVSAVVQLHPGGVEASDYAQVAVPISVLAAPSDGVQQHEALLASRSDLPSFVKVFPDVVHGWAVRYEETDESAVRKANEAHSLMLDWFAKHL